MLTGYPLEEPVDKLNVFFNSFSWKIKHLIVSFKDFMILAVEFEVFFDNSPENNNTHT